MYKLHGVARNKNSSFTKTGQTFPQDIHILNLNYMFNQSLADKLFENRNLF